MTLTLDIHTLFWALVGLGSTSVGAYIAIRADIASAAVKISELRQEVAEAKNAAMRAHTRIDGHVTDWHRASK